MGGSVPGLSTKPSLTDPLLAARALRRERLELVRPAAESVVEQRDLAVCDSAGAGGGVASWRPR